MGKAHAALCKEERNPVFGERPFLTVARIKLFVENVNEEFPLESRKALIAAPPPSPLAATLARMPKIWNV
jgi:hypothetical protein